jgi:hypothetical protein
MAPSMIAWEFVGERSERNLEVMSETSKLGLNPKNETVRKDTLCRKGNCEWQRDDIRRSFDNGRWSV